MFQWVKLRGSTLYEGLGAVLLLPIKWPRLTGAIGTGLQRRHIACGGMLHETYTRSIVYTHSKFAVKPTR